MVVAFKKPSNQNDPSDLLLAHNAEAEEAVLGGVLIDPGAIAVVAPILPEASVFHLSTHQLIWQSCLELHAESKPVNLMSVAQQMHSTNRLDTIGGRAKLAQLADRAVSSINIDYLAHEVRKSWQQREAARISDRFKKIVADPSADLSEARGYLDQEIAKLGVPAPRTLRDAVREAIAHNPGASQKQATILKLADEWKAQPKEIKELWDAIALEIERTEARQETAEELDVLLKAKNSRLDISLVLPTKLANPIKFVAGELGLRPETYLTTLLVTTSTLFPNGTWARLWDRTDFEVTPNLFGAIVAEPSQYKSPVLKAIATKPLAELQREAKEYYEKAYKCYKFQLAAWQKEKNDDDPPEEPQRRIYYFTDSTSEGIVKQFAVCPQAGLLNLVDELAGKFKSANQYRGGRGSDEEDLLSLYDGTGKVTLRAGGIKSDLDDGLNFGLLGSIQPKVLQRFLRDCEDSNGNWARFIFVNQPLAMAEWKSDGGGVDLTPMLAELYRKVSCLPATTYTLSPEAKEAFRKARNRAEYLRIEETRPGMQAYWGKVPGRIGKLALNLHVIHCLFDGDRVTETIPVERVREAIKLCGFYADQILSLYGFFEDPTALSPQLAKIVELATNKKGLVTLREISRATKWKAEQVKHLCDELVAMKRGSLTKVGKAIAFQLSPTVENSVTVPVTHQTLENKDFQPTVETVTKCHQFSEKPSDSRLELPPSMEDEKKSPDLVTVSPVGDSSRKPHPTSDPTVTKTVTESAAVGDSLGASADTHPAPLSEGAIADCLDTIRVALAHPAAPEIAEAAKELLSVALSPAAKQQVWAALSPDERKAFTRLLTSPVPTQQPTLGISIPSAPPSEGNPKGRRLR